MTEDKQKKEWPFEAGTPVTQWKNIGTRITPKIISQKEFEENQKQNSLYHSWSVSFSADNLPTDEPATDETFEDKEDETIS